MALVQSHCSTGEVTFLRLLLLLTWLPLSKDQALLDEAQNCVTDGKGPPLCLSYSDSLDNEQAGLQICTRCRPIYC